MLPMHVCEEHRAASEDDLQTSRPVDGVIALLGRLDVRAHMHLQLGDRMENDLGTSAVVSTSKSACPPTAPCPITTC